MIAYLTECLRQCRLSALPPDRLRQWQEQRLRAIVRHAYERVPLYRDLYDRAGIRPGDIRRIDDLPRLPIVDKLSYRRAPPESRQAAGLPQRGLHQARTSGTQGIPLRIVLDALFYAQRNAVILRAKAGLGLYPWNRTLYVGPYREQRIKWYRQIFYKICHLHNAAGMLRMHRPHILAGFVTPLSVLARDIETGRIPAPDCKALLVWGEVLSDASRDYLQKRYRAPVYQVYACHEFGFMAISCRAHPGILHLVNPGLLIEAQVDGRPAAPHEFGELVVTSLHSHAQPFIRYRLGDLVRIEPGPCACGRPGPVIREIAGRQDDILHDRQGRPITNWLIHWGSFLYRENDVVIQYRITERALGSYRIELVTESEPDEKLRDGVIALFHKLFDAVEVDVIFTDRIEPDANGKLRRVISHVSKTAGAEQILHEA